MPVQNKISLLFCLVYCFAGMAQGNSAVAYPTDISNPAMQVAAPSSPAVAGPLGDLSFYFRQGYRDATIEHGLSFSTESDELDYWRDQRTYERSLYEQNAREYAIYLLAKQRVYARHSNECSDSKSHGDYFHLQASFYSQFATEDTAVILWLDGFTTDQGLAGISRH